MDAIVARYSSSPSNNPLAEADVDAEECSDSLPPLSLKFALPPVDKVRFAPLYFVPLPPVCSRDPYDARSR